MDNKTEKQILALINREVIPAVGCTEPAAVSLACAKVAELMEGIPNRIDVKLSTNVLKNAMGVGIPGTGMVGLPIAVAVGAVIARPDKGLEILQEITPEALHEAKCFMDEGRITIGIKENVDKLYIEVIGMSGKEHATAIIGREHNRFIYLERKGEILLDERQQEEAKEKSEKEEELKLSFGLVYEFATETSLETIAFIRDTARINREAAESSMRGAYGHMVGKIIGGSYGQKFMGDNPFTHMLKMTAAACDARMDGALIPVYSNSGSGNQGIAATLPVVSFAEDIQCSEEQLTRALMMSHLMVIYIKQSLGRLSALCGCVVAATGASSAITWLMGGNKQQISYAIKNMIGNITGMICDGAKPSCALKVSSGVSTAMLSAIMAMEDKTVTPIEGIIDECVDCTIQNLTLIGSKGMEETDRLVLDIMTGKSAGKEWTRPVLGTFTPGSGKD